MSGNLRAGLIVLGVLSLLDLLTPLLTDGDHPPMSVAIGSAAIGAVSLVCLAFAWVRDSGKALFGLIALRLLSALLSVPAFFIDAVPAVASAAAAVLIALTLVGTVLCLSGSRRTTPAVAP
jgi:hypothetical protein